MLRKRYQQIHHSCNISIMSFNNEYFYQCPYCGAENFIMIDFTGGESQSFINDCENCCRPIQIRIELRNTEVLSFSAETE